VHEAPQVQQVLRAKLALTERLVQRAQQVQLAIRVPQAQLGLLGQRVLLARQERQALRVQLVLRV